MLLHWHLVHLLLTYVNSSIMHAHIWQTHSSDDGYQRCCQTAFARKNTRINILMIIPLQSWARTYLRHIPRTGITGSCPTLIHPEHFPVYQCTFPSEFYLTTYLPTFDTSTFLKKMNISWIFQWEFFWYGTFSNHFSGFPSFRIFPCTCQPFCESLIDILWSIFY